MILALVFSFLMPISPATAKSLPPMIITCNKPATVHASDPVDLVSGLVNTKAAEKKMKEYLKKNYPKFSNCRTIGSPSKKELMNKMKPVYYFCKNERTPHSYSAVEMAYSDAADQLSLDCKSGATTAPCPCQIGMP